MKGLTKKTCFAVQVNVSLISDMKIIAAVISSIFGPTSSMLCKDGVMYHPFRYLQRFANLVRDIIFFLLASIIQLSGLKTSRE